MTESGPMSLVRAAADCGRAIVDLVVVQLHDQFAIVVQLVVLVTSVTALESNYVVVEATRAVDIVDDKHELGQTIAIDR